AKGAARLAAVQVWFQGSRHRDYLILYVPKRANKSAKRESKWWVRSLPPSAKRGGFDLRNPADAAALEEALARVPVTQERTLRPVRLCLHSTSPAGFGNLVYVYRARPGDPGWRRPPRTAGLVVVGFHVPDRADPARPVSNVRSTCLPSSPPTSHVWKNSAAG